MVLPLEKTNAEAFKDGGGSFYLSFGNQTLLSEKKEVSMRKQSNQMENYPANHVFLITEVHHAKAYLFTSCDV